MRMAVFWHFAVYFVSLQYKCRDDAKGAEYLAGTAGTIWGRIDFVANAAPLRLYVICRNKNHSYCRNNEIFFLSLQREKQQIMFTYKYPRPAVTADCVVFAQVKDQVKVLLIERGDEPCKGMWAIPGGFMNMNETAEEAAVRELKEETGIELTKVEQIGAFSKVDRDPRGRVITVAFYAVIGKAVKAVGQDDARRAKWFPLTKLPALAFDHAEILAAAKRLAFKTEAPNANVFYH